MKKFKTICVICVVLIIVIFSCSCYVACLELWDKDPMKQETFFQSGYYLCYTDNSIKTLLSPSTIIFGLTDEGKKQKQLVLPSVLDEKLIGWFGEITENPLKWNYFESYELERLYIPFDVSIGSKYVLEKCYNLKEVIDVSCYEKRKLIPLEGTTVYVAEQVLATRTHNFPNVNFKAANVEFRDTVVRDNIWDLMYDNKGIFWLDNLQPGELIPLPPKTPHKSQTEKFVGWCVDEECEIFWDFENDKMPEDGKLVLYPKFQVE